VLLNVSGVDHKKLDANAAIADTVAQVEALLGDTGRVLLRPSGTEPLVRVMVEALDKEQAKSIADSIAQVVREQLS